MAVPKPSPSLDLDFDEAVAYFRRHRAVTKEEWDKLDAAARKRAVRVASIAHRGVLNDVWKALEKNVAEGGDFRRFKAEIAKTLRQKYGAETAVPAHLETIYLNETQRAFTHGRIVAALDPDVRQARPFWQFRAIEDNRITPICKECNGTIEEAGGAWWRSHMPPLHHRCRSSFVPLTPAEAGRRGGTTSTPPKGSAQKGFGEMPNLDDDGGDLEAAKAEQTPRELAPPTEPKIPEGRPGHPEPKKPRKQPSPQPLELPIEAAPLPPKPPEEPKEPKPVGDPIGEPVGEEIGEPILPPKAPKPAPKVTLPKAAPEEPKPPVPTAPAPVVDDPGDPPAEPAPEPKQPREKGPKGGTGRPLSPLEQLPQSDDLGSDWTPGRTRSQVYPTGSSPAPWLTDADLRPPHPVTNEPGAGTPAPHEARIDDLVSRQGNKVVRRDDSPPKGLEERRAKEGVTRPDRTINGHVVEYASLLGTSGTALTRMLGDKIASKQAQFLIVDVTANGMSRAEALYSVNRVAKKLAEGFLFVRIIGRGYDFTVSLPTP